MFPVSPPFDIPDPAVTDIQHNCQHQANQQYQQRYIFHQPLVKIGPGHFQQQEMDIGIRLIHHTEGFPHFPVQVGTDTIAPAIKDAEYKPGKGCQHNGSEMQIAPSSPGSQR